MLIAAQETFLIITLSMLNTSNVNILVERTAFIWNNHTFLIWMANNSINVKSYGPQMF